MIEALDDGHFVRLATAADHPALLSVCLLTGANGNDATPTQDDPDLLGMFYAVPYQVLEPDLALVIEGPQGVAGYVLGALDTAHFNRRFEEEWLMPLRQRVRDPGTDRSTWTGSDAIRALIHRPRLEIAPEVARFRSHGHIDLLPGLQGKGYGRRLMELLWDRLRAAGSPGMHLGVSPSNTKAIGYYERMGFRRLTGPGIAPAAYVMAISLA